jgi:hypothetical protein
LLSGHEVQVVIDLTDGRGDVVKTRDGVESRFDLFDATVSARVVSLLLSKRNKPSADRFTFFTVLTDIRCECAETESR